MSIGYIYVRTNKAWDMYDAVKLGITYNIFERNREYMSLEIMKGVFELIIEIDQNILTNVKKSIKKYFNSLDLHIKYDDGGNDFYKKDIVDLVIPYLVEHNIKHKTLSTTEIFN
jgi:hypothetical protein